jgi:molecular chaperone DnaK
MMPSRLVRAVCASSPGTSSQARSSGLTLHFLFQLPRTARTPAFRVPGASFRRWNSTEGEKVKGQVIGIDLGMLLRQYSCLRFSF